MKTYSTSDLFFTRWEDLKALQRYEAYTLNEVLKDIPRDHERYGFILIAVLRRLRKRPGLVSKITVEQAVDIYNDMKFLSEPWFIFPEVHGLRIFDHQPMHPDDHLARHTFDHFIYADNEFSMWLLTREKIYLKRLLVTLYQMPFEKESVEDLAQSVKIEDWLLNLVAITFNHVRTKLTRRCKTLLPPPPKGEAAPADPSATGPMWLKIKHRLAETPAFQGYDVAGRANMYAALDYLEDLAQQKEDAQRKAHKPR